MSIASRQFLLSASRAGVNIFQRAYLSSFSGNISYSGGQATDQGGFYASGGARVATAAIQHHPGMSILYN